MRTYRYLVVAHHPQGDVIFKPKGELYYFDKKEAQQAIEDHRGMGLRMEVVDVMTFGR